MLDESSGCTLLKVEYNGKREELQKTESAKICSRIVPQLRPEANAMTWESVSKTCWAVYEATGIRNEQCQWCISCLFGNSMFVVIVKVDVTLKM